MHFDAMAYAERTLRTRWLALTLVALVLGVVGGCGGGGGGSKILYAVGLGSPNVAIFTVSSAGTLTFTGSVSTGSAPDAIGIDPLLRFAYIVDSGGGIAPGGVSQYVLTRSTGVLTVATLPAANGTSSPSTPIETGVGPAALAIDGTGSFAFVANTGAIPPNSACSPTPSVCAPSLSVYTIDPTGGALTEVKQTPTSGPTPLNCMPNQPVPCPLPLPPSAVPGAPVVPAALATTGNMLFVAMTNAGMGSIATYMFTPAPATQSLTQVPCPTGPGCLQNLPASTIAAGTNPVAMAMGSSGNFLFVADSVANTVAAFSIGTSGQLSAVGTGNTGTTPVSVSVHPTGNFLYTVNQGGANCVNGSVSAFSISSGALTALPNSPFAAGPCPSYVAIDSSGSFLFVANGGTNNISVFSIDSSGALKPLSNSSFVVVNPIALASIN